MLLISAQMMVYEFSQQAVARGVELFQVPEEPIVFHRLKPTVAGQWQ